jgi:hypothetical protein
MGGSKPCDANSILEPGFGEGYAYLKRSSSTLSEQFKDARIQYEIPRIPKLVSGNMRNVHKNTFQWRILLSLWRTVLLHQLTGTQLLRKFPSIYATRRFTVEFTRNRHGSLSWARCIQFTTSHPISLRSAPILSSCLRINPRLVSSRFQTNISYPFLISLMRATC